MMTDSKNSNAQQLAEAVVAKMLEKDAFSRWLGLCVTELAPGRAVCRMTVRDEMLNGFLRAHGGIAYSLADSALAFAANTCGRVTVSIENVANYPAPVVAGDELEACAEEQSAGRRIALYNVNVRKSDGTLVCAFRGTVYRTDKEFFPDGDRPN
ncbi:MAG: hotdog fold thioesterase [Bdellovibrionales bacterium]|nr:hotdog fold thioesterase [Bdellovibrionales bacterium]